MADACSKNLDPRVRRTRQLLVDALQKVLETKSFEELSIQDIAEAATVNRATFYAHYPDKFALLECMVGSRFQELLTRRGISFNGACSNALRAIVLGVCDYLASMTTLECERQRQLEPHLESAVIAVVRVMLLEGLQRHPSRHTLSAEMVAAAASWAIFGAAKEWIKTPERPPSEHAADAVMTLIAPILSLPGASPQVA